MDFKMDTPMNDIASAPTPAGHSPSARPPTQQGSSTPSKQPQQQQQQSQQTPQQDQQHRKRVRVSRACDECRLRKTRCDGRQPCAGCQTFERHCSFNLNQGRKPAQRTRILEDRLRRAHLYIKELQKELPRHQQIDADALFAVPAESEHGENGDELEEDKPRKSSTREKSLELDSMLDRKGHITSGNWYAGESSGFAFLLKTRELLKEESSYGMRSSSRGTHRSDDAAGKSRSGSNDNKDDSQHYAEEKGAAALVELYDAPIPGKQVLDLNVPLAQLLPTYDAARMMLSLCISSVYPLLQFMDEDDIERKMKRIYSCDPVDFTDEDHDFVPLLYMVIGLGVLLSRQRHSNHGCDKAVAHAMRYYIAASKMVDITRARTLPALQTLICFSLFLLSTARLATCHTYTGVAMASALKLGLHVLHPANASFDEHQNDLRRRIFWTITKLSGYCSSILGLPLLLDTASAEVTAEAHITEVYETALTEFHKKNSQVAYSMATSAAHFKLLVITAQATSNLFTTVQSAHTSDSRFPKMSVNSSKIMDAEVNLTNWCESTQEILNYEDDRDGVLVTKFDLRMTLAFSRLQLYKPFLHYLSRRHESSPSQLRLAYACVTVAQEAIHTANDTLEGALLGQASFPAMYTVFMAVTCLVFFVATRLSDLEHARVKADAETGIRVLASATCPGTGAAQCLDVLSDLIRCLSEVVDIDVDTIRKSAHSYCQRPPRNLDRISAERQDPAANTTAILRRPEQENEEQEHSTKVRQQQQQHQYASHHAGPTQQSNRDYLTSTDMFPVAPYPSLIGAGLSHNMMFQQYPDVSAEHTQYDAIHMPFDSSFSWSYDPAQSTGSYGIDQVQQRNPHVHAVPDMLQFPMNPQHIASYLGHEQNPGASGSSDRRSMQ